MTTLAALGPAHRPALLILAALLAALLAPCRSAPAQLPGAERNVAKENEELSARVKELESQLEGAQKRIQNLNNEIDKLKAEIKRLRGDHSNLGGGGAQPGGPAPQGGPATSGDPFSSPEALLKALVSDYEKKFGALPRQTKAEQARLQREVEAWVRAVRPQFRGQAEWVIHITKNDFEAAPGRGSIVTYEVVNPNTGQPIGRPVSSPFQPRFAKMIADQPAQKHWRITGTVMAKPTANAQRVERGTSDSPAFIGPFAEFDFDLIVANMTPAEVTAP